MKVKAIRKGYHKGLKLEGAVFEFSGSKCPSWCQKITQKKPALKKKEE